MNLFCSVNFVLRKSIYLFIMYILCSCFYNFNAFLTAWYFVGLFVFLVFVRALMSCNWKC